LEVLEGVVILLMERNLVALIAGQKVESKDQMREERVFLDRRLY
jgi:hypothetical protein